MTICIVLYLAHTSKVFFELGFEHLRIIYIPELRPLKHQPRMTSLEPAKFDCCHRRRYYCWSNSLIFRVIWDVAFWESVSVTFASVTVAIRSAWPGLLSVQAKRAQMNYYPKSFLQYKIFCYLQIRKSTVSAANLCDRLRSSNVLPGLSHRVPCSQVWK